MSGPSRPRAAIQRCARWPIGCCVATAPPHWATAVAEPDMARLPRIAFFIRALKGGGAQRDTILLANAIAARGAQVDLLTLVPDGPLRPLISTRVSVVPIGGGKLRAAVPGLRRALIERRPGAL